MSMDARNSQDAQKRRDSKKRFFKKKVCFMCTNNINDIDYKNVPLLRRFITERGKILPRRITGTCAKHQRLIARQVKRARSVALVPFEDK